LEIKPKRKKLRLVDNLRRRVLSGWIRHENRRIRSRRRCQRWETWPVEKSLGKDAGKDAEGGAAVEHTNFAAKDYDMHFYFYFYFFE
jgi:hypothetical protein